ncbi:unnamed protein product [Sphagnum jensenii]|uniref:Uncharacterized protein n=1 Tax=Sphagnum jensenii TaxID=128206 RepID=A0ABP0VC78_9BRYO
MPRNISTLVSTLLKRAAIDTTDPKYLDLLNITGQIGEEAYHEVEGAINKLMTLDEARYHNELRKHFRQNTLDPIDKELERWFEDMGVADEDKAEVLADRNTYTRLRRALEKTRELERKKAGEQTADDRQRTTEELAAAHKQVEELKAQFEVKAAELENRAEQRITDYALQTKLSSLDYANDKISREEAVMAFRPLLDHELKSRGAKYILNKETNDLDLIQAETGQPLTEGGRPVSFSDFLGSIAAAKRVLKTHKDAGPQTPEGGLNSRHITYPTHIPAGRSLPRSNQNALHIIESKLKGG